MRSVPRPRGRTCPPGRPARRPALVPVVALAVAVAVLAGCAEDGDGTPDPGDGATAGTEVAATGFAFAPASITVPAGTTVTWTNEDGAAHTVTAGDGSFDEPLAGGGGTASVTFGEPGTVAYVCALHPSMTGEVVVTG